MLNKTAKIGRIRHMNTLGTASIAHLGVPKTSAIIVCTNKLSSTKEEIDAANQKAASDQAARVLLARRKQLDDLRVTLIQTHEQYPNKDVMFDILIRPEMIESVKRLFEEHEHIHFKIISNVHLLEGRSNLKVHVLSDREIRAIQNAEKKREEKRNRNARLNRA